MGRWPKGGTSLLSLLSVGSSLPQTVPDEVWLLQLPGAKAGRARAKRGDPVKGLDSPELRRHVELENPSLHRFRGPESSSEPWFFSDTFDELPFGNTVPTGFSDFDGAHPWLPAVEARIERLRKRSERRKGPFQYPLVGNSRDNGDYGQIFEKIYAGERKGAFALRTVHGKFLKVANNSRLIASASLTNESQQLFRFEKLPFEDNLFFWYAEGRPCCVKANPRGVLVSALMNPSGNVDPFIFKLDQEQGYVTLRNLYGRVVAGLDSRLVANWSSSTLSGMSYEVGEDVKDNVLGVFQNCGFISGVVIACLCFLAAYNVVFASTRASAPSTRLATFDVVRFVLESLVLHGHIGLQGVYDVRHASYMTSFRMPAFVFVAGMFGSSMTYESLSKVLCCTLGTTAILTILRLLCMGIIHSPERAWNLLLHLDLSRLCGDYWFLVLLAFCRVFVTPVFYATKTYGSMRGVVPFLLVKIASYFLMHKAAVFSGWIFGMSNWHQALAFMPYFALGLLLTPTEWDVLLRRRAVQLVCVGYFILWYLLMMSPSILQWNRSFCLPQRQKHGCVAHFDPGQILDPITPQQFELDMVFFALRSGITISFTGVVVALSEVVGYFSPYLVELMAGWGSRTLYAYVIQQFCIATLMMDGRFFAHMPRAPRGVRLALEIVLPVFVNIVFSSKGTEHLFRWLLVPYWMKQVGENPNLIDYPRWLENKARLAAGATRLAEKTTSATRAWAHASAGIFAAAGSAWARARAKLAACA